MHLRVEPNLAFLRWFEMLSGSVIPTSIGLVDETIVVKLIKTTRRTFKCVHTFLCQFGSVCNRLCYNTAVHILRSIIWNSQLCSVRSPDDNDHEHTNISFDIFLCSLFLSQV